MFVETKKTIDIGEVRKLESGLVKYVLATWPWSGPASAPTSAKYVKQEWRFAVVKAIQPIRHSEMLKAGETAVAAGLLSMYKDHVAMENSYSRTLKVGTDLAHWDELQTLLGKTIETPKVSTKEKVLTPLEIFFDLMLNEYLRTLDESVDDMKGEEAEEREKLIRQFRIGARQAAEKCGIAVFPHNNSGFSSQHGKVKPSIQFTPDEWAQIDLIINRQLELPAIHRTDQESLDHWLLRIQQYNEYNHLLKGILKKLDVAKR